MSRGKHWRAPVRHVEDGLVVTHDGIGWGWWRLPTVTYRHRSAGERHGYTHRLTAALAALQDREAHLLIVPRPVDSAAWAAALDATVDDPAPGWGHWLDQVVAHLDSKQLHRREVYLGVKIGRRRTTVWRSLAEHVHRLAGVDDPAGHAGLDEVRGDVAALGRTVQATALAARPARVDELAWLIQRAMHRGLAVPAPHSRQPWRHGTTQALYDGVIHHQHRRLHTVQPDGQSWQTWLTVAQMPDRIPLGRRDPWLAWTETLPWPVEISIRFQVVAGHHASQDVAKRLADAADQHRHTRQAGIRVPLDVVEAEDTARQLQHAVSRGSVLVYMWPRLAVAADDPDVLEDHAAALIAGYRRRQIRLARPAGSQLSLWAEALPGGRLEMREYAQQADVAALAAGAPTVASAVGDDGPYLGWTVEAPAVPVSLDPLAAAGEDTGTVVAIAGDPGGGKTVAAELLAWQAALRGGQAVILDPKQGSTALRQLPGLHDVRLVTLDRQQAGILDPYTIGLDDPVTAAVDTMRALLPEPPGMAEALLHDAAAKEHARADTPSLSGAVARLGEIGDRQAGQLARLLGQYQTLPLAQLCFTPADAEQLHDTARGLHPSGLTVIQLDRLEMPEPGTPRREMTLAERLASTLIQLLATWLYQAAAVHRDRPTLLMIDEAWAVTSTPQGRRLIRHIAREGRQRNASLLMVSQQPSDFAGDVQTGISAAALFRVDRPRDEIDAGCRLVGVEPSDDVRRTIQTLGVGQCLLRDRQGRTAKVRIDLVFDELLALLETNPAKLTAAAVDR